MTVTRQHGFTLVEMLVSLSVAALLVSLVYGAVRTGQRSVSALDTRVEQAEMLRIGWRFLYSALARSRAVAKAADDAANGFSGGSDWLSFIADMPPQAGPGGLFRFHLGIESERGRRRLVLTRQYHDTAGTDPAGGTARAVLVDDLDTLEISYLGQSQRDAVLAWSNDWPDTGLLPSLVRIRVQPVDAPPWPVMIAQPIDARLQLDAEVTLSADDVEFEEQE